MALHFLFNKMALCNLKLFFSCVGRKFYNLHTVEQRLGNRAQIVGCGNKHNIRQIKRNLNVVVTECYILFGVKNFQHGGSRVAPEIVAHFVDFIEQNECVFASRKLHGVHNSSGHCAYICFSMTANVRFVFHSAQRNSGIFSSHCRRNVFCD